MPTLKPDGCLGLVLHPTSDPAAVVGKIASWARSHGKEVIADARDAARVPGVEAVSEPELIERSDSLVSLGGDGTLLGALRLVAHRPVPVLGVNLGHLGFLVEIDPDELPEALDRLEAEEFTLEPHSALLIDAEAHAVGFNDLALVRIP